jgi:hypothetical protein
VAVTNGVADIAEPRRPRGPRHRRRAVLLAIAASVVLIAGLVTFLATRHLDGQYGPIDSGNTAGPYTLRNVVTGKDRFSTRLSTVPGASAQFFQLVGNEGSHSVEITSMPTDSIVSDIRWSIYRTTATGSNLGDNEPWHHFPAIVPADGQIRLLVTIHRPASCRNRPESTSVQTDYIGYHVVHWQSLLHDHTSTIQFPSDYGIQVC